MAETDATTFIGQWLNTPNADLDAEVLGALRDTTSGQTVSEPALLAELVKIAESRSRRTER